MIRARDILHQVLAAAEPKPAGSKLSRPALLRWLDDHQDQPVMRVHGQDIEVTYIAGSFNNVKLGLAGYANGLNADATTDPAAMYLTWKQRNRNTELRVSVVRGACKTYTRVYGSVQAHGVDKLLRAVIAAYLNSPHGTAFLENYGDL